MDNHIHLASKYGMCPGAVNLWEVLVFIYGRHPLKWVLFNYHMVKVNLREFLNLVFG